MNIQDKADNISLNLESKHANINNDKIKEQNALENIINSFKEIISRDKAKIKLKVVQVSRLYLPHIGGVESVVDQIKNVLLKNTDYELEILSCSNKFKSERTDRLNIKRFKYLLEFKSNNISLSLLWNLFRLKTDILHYHQPYIFAAIAHFIARPKYKKLVITYHSDIVGYDKYMKFLWPLFRWFLKKADKITVLSPNLINSSLILREFKEKCVVIPYGLDINKYTLSDNDKVIKMKQKYNNKKILLGVGRFVTYKGFSYLIEAMNHVNDAVLILIGSGPLRQDIENKIKEYNLQNKIIILNNLTKEELQLHFQACDIFVFPSIMQSEAFGIVQLEAMVHGKPIINTNLGTGVNYVSIHNETGLTVEPQDIKQLADAINLLIKDDELRLKFGQNAQLRIKERFSLDKIQEEYSKLYMSILDI